METVNDYASRNDELIEKLQAAATQEERGKICGELYENNRGFIARICYRWSLFKNVELADLLQEAYFFVVRAADCCAKATQEEPVAGFIAYLRNALNWGFIAYFCKNSYLHNEVCCLDAPLTSDEDSSARIDFIVDESQNVEEDAVNRIYSEEAEQIFLDTIKSYPPPIREVLFRRLILRHKLKTIAGTCSKSPERIRQIYRDGLRLLRSSNIRARLSEIENDEADGSIAYMTSSFTFWKEHGNTSSVELIAMIHEQRQSKSHQTREQRRAALYGLDDLF